MLSVEKLIKKLKSWTNLFLDDIPPHVKGSVSIQIEKLDGDLREWFQQDEDPEHYGMAVRDCLNYFFLTGLGDVFMMNDFLAH